MDAYIGYIFVLLLGIFLGIIFAIYIWFQNRSVKKIIEKEQTRIKIVKVAAENFIKYHQFLQSGALDTYPWIRNYLGKCEILLRYYTFYSEKQKDSVSVVSVYPAETKAIYEEIRDSQGKAHYSLLMEVARNIELFYKTEQPIKYRVDEFKRIKKNVFRRIGSLRVGSNRIVYQRNCTTDSLIEVEAAG